MSKYLKNGTTIYEYFVHNGDLRVEVVYISDRGESYRGELCYYIKSRETKERHTMKDCIQEIEKGIYQCPSWKDHFYMIKRNDKKALKLFIKYYEEKAEVLKTNLNNCLTKINYLKFRLKNEEDK